MSQVRAVVRTSTPDSNGYVTATIPGAPYLVKIHRRTGQQPGCIYVDDKVSTDRDSVLAGLRRQEQHLGDLRWTRGENADVDTLYTMLNARWALVREQIAREVLRALADVLDGDLTHAIAGSQHNLYAGCRDCRCSPGVMAGTRLRFAGEEVVLDIQPA